MHSIRTRITSLTTAAILACALLIGTISVFTVKAREEQSAEQLMTLLCSAKCDVINNYLGSVEQSGETVSRYAFDSLDVEALAEGDVIGATGSGRSLTKRKRTQQQQETLDAHLQKHVQAVKAVFDTISSSNSLLSYYYRINPEISTNIQGFWYSKHDSVNYEELELTDISAYSVDDFARVGWYYLPIERGRPSWLNPYENKNLDTSVVSYIIPLYKAGTFIGLIGMDVSYDTLVDKISDLEVLDTGYAFLTDEKGKIIYHPVLENEVLIADVSSKLGATQYEEKSGKLISYTFGGIKKKAAWGTLSNGLKLIVSAPATEINAGWRSLSWIIAIASLLIMAVFVWLTAESVRQVTVPLENLARASEQIAEGDYSVALSYEGSDEVGTLTRAFQQMADHLQFFFIDLDSKANRDALTSVRNKYSYDVFRRELDEMIRNASQGQGEFPAFAIGMFDCNDLKVINDSFGHEKGDIYLKNACQLICCIFAHSAVFRIGGDEFVAVLQGEDLRDYEQIVQRFDHEAAQINLNAANAWEQVHVARGVARFEPDRDATVDAVLRRADGLMYLDKRLYKEEQQHAKRS